MEDYSEILLRDGVVVVPVFGDNNLKQYNVEFWNAVEGFPEYLNPESSDTVFVQGAFGALGNPASFHNPLVRHLRQEIMTKAIPFFSKIGSGRNLEQLIDRMAIRRPGTSLSKESWHRDKAFGTHPGDEIFGGWVNLDTNHIQRFSCIPGSHIQNTDKLGFARETNVDETKKVVYDVKPGHWIIFYQNILHEVLPGKIKNLSIRLFLGWRLTTSTEPLCNNTKALQDQGVPFIPSGQLPPMYSPNHMSFHHKKTIEWSRNTFHPQCVEQRNTPKLGEHRVVHKVMKSLAEYGFKMYEPYSDQELALLIPNKQWNISGNILSL